MSKEKKQLKNWWLRIKLLFDSNKKKLMLFFICLFQVIIKSQSANYISNGSFEVLHNCNAPHITAIIKNWMAIDSATSFSGGYCGICNGGVPYPNGGFQYPRTGNASVISTFYCSASVCGPGGGVHEGVDAAAANPRRAHSREHRVLHPHQRHGAWQGDRPLRRGQRCVVRCTELRVPHVQIGRAHV